MSVLGAKDHYRGNPGLLYGEKFAGKKVRDYLDGKFEMIPKTKEHIFVDADKCIGDACAICYTLCPGGAYEMIDGKAVWAFGMTNCMECGICQYVCTVGAIDWSYPEAGTGVVLKWS
ncbi:MAG: 4Fe-4S dicluster domain-containing protein [Coriobacteriia bacterium]|nr:4Fe-4S dicluster domain-containing protein [Coriobacteriia bacterium]